MDLTPECSGNTATQANNLHSLKRPLSHDNIIQLEKQKRVCEKQQTQKEIELLQAKHSFETEYSEINNALSALSKTLSKIDGDSKTSKSISHNIIKITNQMKKLYESHNDTVKILEEDSPLTSNTNSHISSLINTAVTSAIEPILNIINISSPIKSYSEAYQQKTTNVTNQSSQINPISNNTIPMSRAKNNSHSSNTDTSSTSSQIATQTSSPKQSHKIIFKSSSNVDAEKHVKQHFNPAKHNIHIQSCRKTINGSFIISTNSSENIEKIKNIIPKDSIEIIEPKKVLPQ
ncbi:MAG: hypothetical protein H9Q66_06405, partial [Spiroplasma ixodetis]|nr:hypothetical protein [Spiroplasma ixodetis]